MGEQIAPSIAETEPLSPQNKIEKFFEPASAFSNRHFPGWPLKREEMFRGGVDLALAPLLNGSGKKESKLFFCVGLEASPEKKT